MKRLLAIVALGALSGVLASCGASGAGAQRLTLMLDFFPNADHAGIYAAQADGRFSEQKLDVAIRTPSDPSVPLKLLAAGKADLAISYEPEVLRARDKGAPVVAVAALVRVPLTSIVSLPRAGIRRPADLRGKRIATAGIDYQSAYLDAILRRASVPRSSVRELNAGFDLVPALVSGRADAVLGAYWNYEAIQLQLQRRQPRVIRIEQAGVPTYDELVVTATDATVKHRPALVRRFLRALAAGTTDLAQRTPQAVDALVRANPDLDRRLQTASIAVTRSYLEPPASKPYGYLDPAAWRAFTAFMQSSGILSARVDAASAFTNRLLP